MNSCAYVEGIAKVREYYATPPYLIRSLTRKDKHTVYRSRPCDRDVSIKMKVRQLEDRKKNPNTLYFQV